MKRAGAADQGANKLHFRVQHPAFNSGAGASWPSTSAIAADEGLAGIISGREPDLPGLMLSVAGKPFRYQVLAAETGRKSPRHDLIANYKLHRDLSTAGVVDFQVTMSGVFLSYRRSDAGGWAGRLKDHLVLRFGPNKVWQDVDDLAIGTDYLPQILENITTADAVLVIIGPHLLDKGATGAKARLHNPKDVLRLEIQHALKKPSGVVPTLVGGAQMPKSSDLPRSIAPLVKRNGIALYDADWSRAMQLLFERLQDLARAARSAEAVAIPALSDVLKKLDQLQTRYIERLMGSDASSAAAIAGKALRLLDDQMPNYAHDLTLQLFRGFFLKNLAMALRDSGDTAGFEHNLALAAQAFETIRQEAELHLANAYTGAAAIPMLRGQGPQALDLINRALTLAPNHPYALHDREEIRQFFGL